MDLEVLALPIKPHGLHADPPCTQNLLRHLYATKQNVHSLLHLEIRPVAAAAAGARAHRQVCRGVCKRTHTVEPKSVFTRKSDLTLSTVMWKQCRLHLEDRQGTG